MNTHNKFMKGLSLLLLFAIVVYRHRENIVRLIQGKESAVFSKADKQTK